MYQNIFWPGTNNLKTEFCLWCTWFKEKIDFIVFKVYEYESKIH